MTELRGCIPILCTPFHDGGAIDFDSLAAEVDWVIAEGASGVSALAIASEGFKLTDAERDDVARSVVEAVGGRVPVVVSADGAGTTVAVDRARRAEALGADALMVLPPYFVKPDQEQLFDYYSSVGRAVEIPVMIQAAPQLTGVPMGSDLWVRLWREVESIRYVKWEGTPQGPPITETIEKSGGGISVFCGWGGLGMIDALERGAAGSMPAPNFTRMFADVQVLFEAGRHSEAEARFARSLPFVLWSMQGIEYSIAAAKEEFGRRGVFSSASQRSPGGELDAINQDQLRRWIDAVLEGEAIPSPDRA